MASDNGNGGNGGNGNGDYGGNGITQRNGATEDLILLLARLSGERLPSRHSIALQKLHCSCPTSARLLGNLFGPAFARIPCMFIDASTFNYVTGQIIGAAIEVHRTLGPGLLESIDAPCLQFELSSRRLRFVAQRAIPIIYKGTRLDASISCRSDRRDHDMYGLTVCLRCSVSLC